VEESGKLGEMGKMREIGKLGEMREKPTPVTIM